MTALYRNTFHEVLACFLLNFIMLFHHPLSQLPSGISNFSKLSTIPPSKISQCCSASMVPWTSVSTPTLFYPIQPYTIRWFPPPCLTVGVVVLSESGSPSSSKYRSFHLIQFYWFWSHLTIRFSSNPPLSSFHGIWKIWDTPVCLPSWEEKVSSCQQRSSCLRIFLTIWGVIGLQRMLLMKWVAFTVLSSLPLVIWWIIDHMSSENSLAGHPPLVFSLSPSTS